MQALRQHSAELQRRGLLQEAAAGGAWLALQEQGDGGLGSSGLPGLPAYLQQPGDSSPQQAGAAQRGQRQQPPGSLLGWPAEGDGIQDADEGGLLSCWGC